MATEEFDAIICRDICYFLYEYAEYGGLASDIDWLEDFRRPYHIYLSEAGEDSLLNHRLGLLLIFYVAIHDVHGPGSPWFADKSCPELEAVLKFTPRDEPERRVHDAIRLIAMDLGYIPHNSKGLEQRLKGLSFLEEAIRPYYIRAMESVERLVAAGCSHLIPGYIFISDESNCYDGFEGRPRRSSRDRLIRDAMYAMHTLALGRATLPFSEAPYERILIPERDDVTWDYKIEFPELIDISILLLCAQLQACADRVFPIHKSRFEEIKMALDRCEESLTVSHCIASFARERLQFIADGSVPSTLGIDLQTVLQNIVLPVFREYARSPS